MMDCPVIPTFLGQSIYRKLRKSIFQLMVASCQIMKLCQNDAEDVKKAKFSFLEQNGGLMKWWIYKMVEVLLSSGPTLSSFFI